MKRIATATRELDKFGPGKDGFRKAVPGLTNPTNLSDDWCNGVQESIVRVIERAGLTPDDDHDQFGEALEALAGSRAAREVITVFGFMTEAQIADVKSGGLALDVTDAVIAAFTHANKGKRVGLAATVLHPGCTLILEAGKYNLASLSSAILVQCNLVNKGAEFVVPSAYGGEAIRVGMDAPAYNLAGADISLPDVTKQNTDNDLTVGSIGVRVVNLNASKLRFGRINFFESAMWFGGIGEGTVYNEIHLGQVSRCKRIQVIIPGAGGWCNSNNFRGGNFSQSPNFNGGGVRRAGWRHLLMDGRSPSTSIVGNNWYGTAFEGNTSEYLFEVHYAYGNNWYGCYHETGAPAQPVTVAGDTLTQAGHGRVVGDMVAFNASVAPTGMFLTAAYYVVEVPTADTFKVSMSKGGAVVTFTTAGTAVTYYLATRLLFDQQGGELCSNNRLSDWFMPANIKLDVIETGLATNNGEVKSGIDFQTVNDPADLPPYRAANRSGSAVARPLFAAYPRLVDPNKQPKGWTAALSDRGLVFAAAESETGQLYNSGGVLSYRANKEATGYEIASCRRSPSLLNITSLNCAANAATSVDLALAGASINDHILVTVLNLLPAGLIYSHAYTISAGNIRVVFYNATTAAISLTTQVQAMAIRRFL